MNAISSSYLSIGKIPTLTLNLDLFELPRRLPVLFQDVQILCDVEIVPFGALNFSLHFLFDGLVVRYGGGHAQLIVDDQIGGLICGLGV